MRHGESQWNRENRLTGWTDIDLTNKGKEEARLAAEYFMKNGFHFDKAFCSFLCRAENTLRIVLENCGQSAIEIEKSWQLNENHYGKLQGMYRNQVGKIYGRKYADLWLKSYYCAPPPVDADDIRNPSNDKLYRDIPQEQLPLSESYHDLSKRVIPYWENNIIPSLNKCDEVLVIAHGNSLREILKHIYHIPEKELFKRNLLPANPIVISPVPFTSSVSPAPSQDCLTP